MTRLVSLGFVDCWRGPSDTEGPPRRGLPSACHGEVAAAGCGACSRSVAADQIRPYGIRAAAVGAAAAFAGL
jgi:hypothetical protein